MRFAFIAVGLAYGSFLALVVGFAELSTILVRGRSSIGLPLFQSVTPNPLLDFLVVVVLVCTVAPGLVFLAQRPIRASHVLFVGGTLLGAGILSLLGALTPPSSPLPPQPGQMATLDLAVVVSLASTSPLLITLLISQVVLVLTGYVPKSQRAAEEASPTTGGPSTAAKRGFLRYAVWPTIGALLLTIAIPQVANAASYQYWAGTTFDSQTKWSASASMTGGQVYLLPATSVFTARATVVGVASFQAITQVTYTLASRKTTRVYCLWFAPVPDASNVYMGCRYTT